MCAEALQAPCITRTQLAYSFKRKEGEGCAEAPQAKTASLQKRYSSKGKDEGKLCFVTQNACKGGHGPPFDPRCDSWCSVF